jgi:hypothetical protein
VYPEMPSFDFISTVPPITMPNRVRFGSSGALYIHHQRKRSLQRKKTYQFLNVNKEMRMNAAKLKASLSGHALLSVFQSRAMKRNLGSCHFKLRSTLEMILNL